MLTKHHYDCCSVQLKKLELKLKTFSDLESMLSKECESVERARQKVYTEHARMVATRLGTSSSPNPPNPLLGQQPPVAAQRPAVFTFGPGGQANPIPGSLPSGASSSSQVPNPNSMQVPSLQGLARPVTAGGMSIAQGQYGRQTMMGGITPQQALGRPMMPQGVPIHQVTPPQVLGRPLIPGTNTPAQGLSRPLTAPPGMSRSVPGGTPGGMSQ